MKPSAGARSDIHSEPLRADRTLPVIVREAVSKAVPPVVPEVVSEVEVAAVESAPAPAATMAEIAEKMAPANEQQIAYEPSEELSEDRREAAAEAAVMGASISMAPEPPVSERPVEAATGVPKDDTSKVLVSALEMPMPHAETAEIEQEEVREQEGQQAEPPQQPRATQSLDLSAAGLIMIETLPEKIKPAETEAEGEAMKAQPRRKRTPPPPVIEQHESLIQVETHK
jgi:ribonuclease E